MPGFRGISRDFIDISIQNDAYYLICIPTLRIMASRYFTRSALLAIILSLANAQQSNIIPEDLRSGFKSNGKEVQVSYTNEAVNGFRDGTIFEKDGMSSRYLASLC